MSISIQDLRCLLERNEIHELTKVLQVTSEKVKIPKSRIYLNVSLSYSPKLLVELEANRFKVMKNKINIHLYSLKAFFLIQLTM